MDNLQAQEEPQLKEKLKCDSLACNRDAMGVHNYIPVAKAISPKSSFVTQIMCTHCFHYLSIAEAMEIGGR